MKSIYKKSVAENNIISVSVSNERNKNLITIHNNNIGKQTYLNNNVWDTDILKIIRIIEENQYLWSFETLINKINKGCRHLTINNKSNQI